MTGAELAQNWRGKRARKASFAPVRQLRQSPLGAGNCRTGVEARRSHLTGPPRHNASAPACGFSCRGAGKSQPRCHRCGYFIRTTQVLLSL
jgi:tRNA(Ile2) C34 agmatinyltransferase TiaS